MALSLLNLSPSSLPPPKSTENSETTGTTPIQNVIKSFLVCLKLTGLHHIKGTNGSEKKVRVNCTVFYRCAVVFLLTFNFIFSMGEFMSISSFNANLLNNIISSIWFLQVALFSLNNAIQCTKWDRFYNAWDLYAEEYNINTQLTCRRFSVGVVVCFIIWVLIASAFMGFNISNPGPPSGFMIYIPEEVAMLVLIFIVVAYFYFISTWFLLSSQFMFVCVVLCRLLWKLYDTINKCVDKGTVCANIEQLRQQHDRLCSMIDMADTILCVFVVVTVFSTIPLIILTLYFVLFQGNEAMTFNYLATWWSISLSTLQLCVVFFAGGILNHAVHKPATLLHKTDLLKASPVSALQLSVFLNRLTSQPIGLTALGLFVLDKPTIITFVGSIMTYAIVMIQLKPGDSGNTLSGYYNHKPLIPTGVLDDDSETFTVLLQTYIVAREQQTDKLKSKPQRIRKAAVRQFWMSSWPREEDEGKQQLGQFSSLLDNYLRLEDQEAFQKYTRFTPQLFNEVLQSVVPAIEKGVSSFWQI